MTHVGIRLLKRHLSPYVSRARSGDIIVVTDRGRPVAKLAPLDPDPQAAARELAAQYGIPWTGGAPAGVPLEKAGRLDDAYALSRAVSEDRG